MNSQQSVTLSRFFNQKKYVAATIFIFLLCFQLKAVSQTHHSAKTAKSSKAAQSNTSNNMVLSYQIIPAEGNTFGYDILDHGKKLVHQPSKPGMPGNKGFRKKSDAMKVAKLVIYKINHNQMPPTVSKQELDSLKVK